MSAITEQYIANEIDQMLRKHGLDSHGPVREELKRTAYIATGYSAIVRALGNSDRVMSLDERIAEMKQDPQFAQYFPQPVRVSRRNEAEVCKHFAEIAAGTVIVVDE